MRPSKHLLSWLILAAILAAFPFSGRAQVTGACPAGTAMTVVGSNIVGQACNAVSGVTNASNAPAGAIGEVLTNSASGTSVSSATPTDIVVLTLTPGDWDVYGWIRFIPTGTITNPQAGVSTTAATLPTPPDPSYFNSAGASNPARGQSLGAKRVNISVTTNVSVVGQATIGSGTLTADGYIWGRRAR